MSKCSFVVVGMLMLSGVGLAQPDTVWTLTCGSPEWDYPAQFCQLMDGGFVIVGSTSAIAPPETEWYVVRTNSVGDTLWTRCYVDSAYGCARAVCQPPDNTILCIGDEGRPQHARLRCWDVNGTLLRDVLLADPRPYRFVDILPVSEDQFVICGSEYFGDENVYLARITANGDTVWTRSYGTGAQDIVHDIVRTSDGGYLMVGTYVVQGGSEFVSEIFALKVDSAGMPEWTTTIEDSVNYTTGLCGVELPDGSYMVGGSLQPRTRLQALDGILYLLDRDGLVVRSRVVGDEAGQDQLTDIRVLPSGNLLLGGLSSSHSEHLDMDFWLIYANAAGVPLWEASYNGVGNEYCYRMLTTPDGCAMMGITAPIGAEQVDWWIVKVDSVEAMTARTHPAGITGFQLLNSYPNPFNPMTTISYSLPRALAVELTVFDVLGREVWRRAPGVQGAGDHELRIDGAAWPGGVYLYRLNAGTESAAGKLLLVK